MIQIKHSPQHGHGVFSAEPIPSGAAILQFTGPVLRPAEVHDGLYHLQIEENLYLGPSGAADDFVNHSCVPNAGFHSGLTLVAMRDIAAGEEITWDYSTAIDEEGFSGFACRCGAIGCRGVVQSFRDLNTAIQSRLLPWVLPYLRAKYFSNGD
jgi:SET domain-containing protein